MRSIHTCVAKVSCASLLAITAALPAAARDIPADDNMRSDIVVTGTRASLNQALDEKREAIGIIDGIFAEDIGKFPDLNLAEAIQRIPGVTISRSVTGEGNQVSLRGLPAEFVNVTLNGLPATSGNAGREFDFDVFASELFSNIRIAKTPSADLTEGGLAGTIDVRSPGALELSGTGVLVSAGGQYAVLGKKEATPRFSSLFHWQNESGTVGAVVSAAWSRSILRNDTRQGFRYELLSTSSGLDDLVNARIASRGTIPTVIVNGAAVNDPNQLLTIARTTAYPILPRVGIDLRTRERLGFSGGFQFRPSDKVELRADLLYAKFDELGERHTIDGAPGFSGTNGVSAVPTTLTIVEGNAVNYAVAGAFNNVVQRSESIEETFNSELWHGTAQLKAELGSDLTGRVSAGYSEAREDELRRSYLYQRTGSWSYDLNDPQWPKFAGVGFDYLDPAAYTTPDRPRFRPITREDRLYRGQGDLEWAIDAVGVSKLRLGVEYTDRKKTINQFLETRPTTAVPFTSVFAQLPVDDLNSGAPSGVVSSFLVTDLQKGRNDLLPDSFFAIAGPDLRGSGVVSEKVRSSYMQAVWDTQILGVPLAIDYGVRLAYTDQRSDGFQQAGSNFEPVSVDNRYTDVLPSLNARLSISDRLVVRLSANKAITRPTLTQLSAGTTIGSTNNLTASKGNPELDPFRANQFDAAIEWYFAPESLISVTGFYKDLESFIVSSQVQQIITGSNLLNDSGANVSGRAFTVTLPVNGQGGKLYGMEASVQAPFTFLPAPFDGLGMLANLTLTHSEGTIVQGGIATRQSLQGQSDVSANVIGYFEKGPISLRAAYSYRSSYADQFRADLWPNGTPHTLYVDDRHQLDLSARLKLTPWATLFVDAINVTSTDYYSYDTERGMSRDFFEQGTVYNFGIRASF